LEGRLLSGDASTFLQRCVRHEIGNLRPSEAATALRPPIEEAGGRIEEDAVGIAVEASMGQPYLVQLIGSYVWDDAEDLELVLYPGFQRAIKMMGMALAKRVLLESEESTIGAGV